MVFKNWPDFFPPSIEVWPVQLPGRAERLLEEPFRLMAPLVDAIAGAIRPVLDKSFAFFGHSMGATIGFELAHKVSSTYGLSPVHLFVSGRKAPQIVDTDPVTFNLPENEFVQELRRLGGTPPEILENAELLKLLIPLLRSDFELTQTYQFRPRSQLACPITAIGGNADADVRREDLEAWKGQSKGAFQLHMLPGNHFFLVEQERAVTGIISSRLSGSGGRP